MTISVAIATFNRAQMVEQAIRAALAEDPAEVIVADDASSDHTEEVLNRLAAMDSRIRLIRQPYNSGGVNNWTSAMDAAKGELIAWCSDDDRFLPGHLAASAAYLAAHPEVGLVHSSFVDCWETSTGCSCEARTLRAAEPLVIGAHNLFPYLLRYYDWPFHPSTLVIRREVWKAVGPFDPCFALADTDWFVRAVSQFPAALLPRHGVLNRRHPGNWSNRLGSARMQREIYEIVERALVRAWPRAGLKRACWRLLWSLNVRLRLALTIQARVAGGESLAALAAWETLVEHCGQPLPRIVGQLGARLICAWPSSAAAPAEAARTRVSPL